MGYPATTSMGGAPDREGFLWDGVVGDVAYTAVGVQSKPRLRAPDAAGRRLSKSVTGGS